MRLGLFAVSLAAVGCGGGGPVDPVGTTVSKSIGASGGTVSTPAGASITIPPGALPSNTVISITATAAVPPAAFGTAVGTNYLFGPSGTLFLKPVTMNLPFSRSKLPAGADPAR